VSVSAVPLSLLSSETVIWDCCYTVLLSRFSSELPYRLSSRIIVSLDCHLNLHKDCQLVLLSRLSYVKLMLLGAVIWDASALSSRLLFLLNIGIFFQAVSVICLLK
jgi:hypothetical protein